MGATYVTLMYPGQVDSTDPHWNPAEYPLRYLAEGDSWFSYGSWKLESLLTQLKLGRPAAVVSLAQPGDTIRRMSDIAGNPELDHWLSRPWGAFDWHAVLVSGGGNDVIDDAARIIPASAVAQAAGKPVEEYVDRVQLARTLAEIQDGYRRIVALRDREESPCPGVPLVTHAYDLATPRDAPARFLVVKLGPWLYPAMMAAKIPEARWNDVADHVLGALGAAITALEDELPNFHVARTQGKLRRAAPGTHGESNDWANEIHPNRRGFAALARLVAGPLDALT